MTIKKAISIAHTLSDPSKMPGFAYGIPAEVCRIGSRLVSIVGSVCYGCYALKGFYVRYGYIIKPAQYKRLASITDPRWVDAMVTLIGKACARIGVPYFRWHDSGDLQGPGLAHLEKIAEIARRLPLVKFWLPTREYRTVSLFLAKYGPFPENLIVRLSGHMIDGPPPNIDGVLTSTVHDRGKPIGVACSKNSANKCGPCRDCWDISIPNVSYKNQVTAKESKRIALLERTA
jgi:hypothetical protein